ncbi:hypothetical protein PCK1_000359 [Pneumocystis canis]|nr:hypothetical protein PCK1_000359 [Pneumocystis canis]
MGNLLENILNEKLDEQVILLKTVKNQIIGYPERKKYFIQENILNILNHILLSDVLEESKIQTIFILISLTQGNHSFASCICQTNILDSLFTFLSIETSSTILITVSLKALIAILSSASISITIPTPIIQTFIKILKNCRHQPYTFSNYFQASLVASFIAICGKTSSQQDQFSQFGIFDMLIEIVSLLQDRSNKKTQEHFYSTKLLDAALQALSSLTHNHDIHSSQIAASYRLSIPNNSNDIYPMIICLLKLVKDPYISIRLGASGCLANMYRSGAIPKKYSTDLELIVIPILVRLLDESDKIKEDALLILAYLVTDSDEMQKAACDADVIKKLANILHHINNNVSFLGTNNANEKIIEAVLLAIAALTLFKDDYRKQVINAKIVPYIVSALSHQSAGVRAAACQCTRSLSRSVCILRSNLVDAGITDPLFVLLTDEDLKVKTAACAAVCNLVLDFSPMRAAIMEKGALRIMCQHAKNENSALRLNAVWALKHIVYAAETDIKKSVLAELSYDVLIELCDDPEVSVQEQALDVIRNVICGQQENIDLLLSNIGVSQIVSIIKKKLSSEFTEIITAAIYICVHIASGNDTHRNIIIEQNEILQSILKHITHINFEIRLGCLWTMKEQRNQILKDIGFLEKLKLMQNDSSSDIRERVKTALSQLE